MNDQETTLGRHRHEDGELEPRTIPTFEECYPSSEKKVTKVQHGTFELEIPYRRVNLTNGDHFDAYDTTGPQGMDPRQGVPKIRSEWVAAR